MFVSYLQVDGGFNLEDYKFEVLSFYPLFVFYWIQFFAQNTYQIQNANVVPFLSVWIYSETYICYTRVYTLDKKYISCYILFVYEDIVLETFDENSYS
jgi:hypothetical protein